MRGSRGSGASFGERLVRWRSYGNLGQLHRHMTLPFPKSCVPGPPIVSLSVMPSMRSAESGASRSAALPLRPRRPSHARFSVFQICLGEVIGGVQHILIGIGQLWSPSCIS